MKAEKPKKTSHAGNGDGLSKTFVLIHGSWHGGWAWHGVARELQKKGHRPHAPTLAGHGPKASRRGVTHENCVGSVCTYIQERGLDDIILVGHSFGGSVVQKVAERLSDRIARLVFLDGLVLADGECVFDNLPADYVQAFMGLAAASPDNSMLIPWEIWRDRFMQDAREAEARAVWERLRPQPNQVNCDRLNLERFYSLDIPKSFLYCRQDQALPAGHFHPRMSSRLGACQLLEMDGSHEVMFTRPRELAEKLVEASPQNAHRRDSCGCG
jgi:pimeloyl-ACP methyl ester carboxylesterase